MSETFAPSSGVSESGNGDKPLKKVLVLGSGPIVIGQAAEFDYAGTQACKSLREEGIETVLVNSNPATIMTDEGDGRHGLYRTFDCRVGQSDDRAGATRRHFADAWAARPGLIWRCNFAEAGVLEKYNVRVLGTPLEAIKKAEDRELFKNLC